MHLNSLEQFINVYLNVSDTASNDESKDIIYPVNILMANPTVKKT